MNTKKNLFLLFAACVLMFGAFLLGRNSQVKTIVVPPFPVFHYDSLGVYRVMGIDRYISEDKSLHVAISYIQLGESESVYEMKLNDGEGYYGFITYMEDGTKIGYFYGNNAACPVVFKDDSDENTYLIIDNKKLPLTYVKSE